MSGRMELLLAFVVEAFWKPLRIPLAAIIVIGLLYGSHVALKMEPVQTVMNWVTFTLFAVAGIWLVYTYWRDAWRRAKERTS